MSERDTWEEFFDAHAPVYDDNVFRKNTEAEVDFLNVWRGTAGSCGKRATDPDEIEIMVVARKSAGQEAGG